MRNNNKLRLLLATVFLLMALCTNAQLMEWVIKPEYKDIVHMGGDLYKVKGTNGKWGVYNIQRREMTISAKYDSITPLVEDRALILDAQGTGLYGIINQQGDPVQPLVNTPSMAVMSDYPYYSDGLLVVGVPDGQYYMFGYVDSQGRLSISFEYLYACPFDNGQAMVMTAKGKYQIINKQAKFFYQGNDKIKFMSNPKNGVFVLATGNNRIAKVRLENEKFREVEVLESGKVVDVRGATMSHTIDCRGGKSFSFDNAFHLIEDNSPRTVSPFTPKIMRSVNLKKEQNNGLYGLSYNKKQILTPQFKSVNIYDDSYALVSMPEGGMKGMLRLNAMGNLKVNPLSQTITFSHNQPQNVPVKVECINMSYNPTVELITTGAAGNRTFSCQGSGTITIPYYEAHTTSDVTTMGTIGVDILIDKLKYGHQDIEVKSAHQDGFIVSIGNLPAYSNKSHQASVSVTITATNGMPSASAKAVVNGKAYYFNDDNKISRTLTFYTQQGKVTDVSVSVSVAEEGCPSVHRQKSGKIRDYYDQ